MEKPDIQELYKWLNNLLKEKYIIKTDIKQIIHDFDWGNNSIPLELPVKPANGEQMLINRQKFLYELRNTVSKILSIKYQQIDDDVDILTISNIMNALHKSRLSV